MKKIFAVIVAAVMVMPEVLAIQSGESTQGSEFYFSFMRARRDREKTMTLFVSSETDGQLELTNPQTGTTATYTLSKNAVTSIPLAATGKATPESDVVPTGTHKDCYTTKSGTPQQQGYYAHATDGAGNDIKVSMYASLSGSKTADAACIYPIEALGNDYYVISRSGNTGKTGNDNFPSEALIVATDECDIEIYPTCILEGFSASSVPAKIDVHLRRGETYLLAANSSIGKFSADGARGDNDLTGTRIVLKNDGDKDGNMCKKIAVFSGSQHGSGENTAWNNGDYEYDQLFPVHLWGRRYIVGSPDSYGSAVTRVVASQPCTEVRVNGELKATLNQYGFYEYKDAGNTGCYIEASKPVGVAFFTTGQNTGDDANGAPAMITIAPIEQAVQEMTFNAISNSGISEHSLLITVPTDKCASTTIQAGTGAPTTISDGWTPIASNPQYSSRVYSLGNNTSSAYTIKNPAGFNAYVYGSKGKDVGYGYSVGSAAITNKTNFELNGLKADSITIAMCIDAQTEFIPNLPDNIEVSEVKWVIDEATPVKGAGDTYTYIIGANVYTETLTTAPFKYVANLAPNFYHAKMVVYKTPSTGMDACFINNSGSKDSVETYFFVK
ncbi:MAG: IgGFc-binding protein, partial [Paludibacteraceae bacterium]|nr:IgGFc-binding protein [Paludibacteraceae bacterium]